MSNNEREEFFTMAEIIEKMLTTIKNNPDYERQEIFIEDRILPILLEAGKNALELVTEEHEQYYLAVLGLLALRSALNIEKELK